MSLLEELCASIEESTIVNTVTTNFTPDMSPE